MLALSGKIYSKLITLLIFFLLNVYFLVNGLSEECRKEKNNKVVDCTGLGLTKIPSDVFTANYEKIKLANNPFECNCAITWFLDLIQAADNQKKIVDLKSLNCISPKRLASRLILTLTNADVCLSSTNTTDGTVGNTTTPTQNKTEEPDPCHEKNKLIDSCDPKREICVRKGKSYECLCKQGFKRKPGATECEVYNACHHGNICSKHAQCINEIGTYKCVCKLGYTGDGQRCEDKDECADKSHECHKNAICVNKVGGYKCHCKPGYKQLKEGRLCKEKVSTPTKTYILAAFIAFTPLLMFACLIVYIVRRKNNRRRRAEEALLSDDQVELNMNENQVVLDSQQMIAGMESFFTEDTPIRKTRMPASESVWSEWADYDESRVESDDD